MQARQQSRCLEVRARLGRRNAHQKSVRQTHMTNGKYSWAIDGDGPPVAVPPEDAERYLLDICMNPPGFSRRPACPAPIPRRSGGGSRSKRGAMAPSSRSGHSSRGRKRCMWWRSPCWQYRVDATINSQNQIQRIKTTVNENALGDFNIEHESTNQIAIGGVKWPTAWHSHQGGTTTGSSIARAPATMPTAASSPRSSRMLRRSRAVPESVKQAELPNTVTVEKMGNGIYMLGGGPANSYMVEFSNSSRYSKRPAAKNGASPSSSRSPS